MFQFRLPKIDIGKWLEKMAVAFSTSWEWQAAVLIITGVLETVLTQNVWIVAACVLAWILFIFGAKYSCKTRPKVLGFLIIFFAVALAMFGTWAENQIKTRSGDKDFAERRNPGKQTESASKPGAQPYTFEVPLIQRERAGSATAPSMIGAFPDRDLDPIQLVWIGTRPDAPEFIASVKNNTDLALPASAILRLGVFDFGKKYKIHWLPAQNQGAVEIYSGGTERFNFLLENKQSMFVVLAVESPQIPKGVMLDHKHIAFTWEWWFDDKWGWWPKNASHTIPENPKITALVNLFNRCVDERSVGRDYSDCFKLTEEGLDSSI